MEILQDYSLQLDIRSSGIVDCAENQTTEIDLYIPEDRYLTGIEYVLKGGQIGDSATLQIIYQGAVVRQIASDILVLDGLYRYESYRAEIFSGMTIKVIYKNIGTMSAKFGFNAILHKQK